jgi:hypothetical protein
MANNTIHPEKLKNTTALGAFSMNTGFLIGELGNVIVKPTIETTVYDIKIVNNIGATVYERTGEEGTLSELLEMPLHGIYGVYVSNATRNEDFQIMLMIKE